MTEKHDDRQPEHGVRGASRTAHRESEESPEIARRDSGNPNADREYLQDLPPADAERGSADAERGSTDEELSSTDGDADERPASDG